MRLPRSASRRWRRHTWRMSRWSPLHWPHYSSGHRGSAARATGHPRMSKTRACWNCAAMGVQREGAEGRAGGLLRSGAYIAGVVMHADCAQTRNSVPVRLLLPLPSICGGVRAIISGERLCHPRHAPASHNAFGIPALLSACVLACLLQ